MRMGAFAPGGLPNSRSVSCVTSCPSFTRRLAGSALFPRCMRHRWVGGVSARPGAGGATAAACAVTCVAAHATTLRTLKSAHACMRTCVQWFITVFSYNFPPETVVRIWDVYLSEGWKVVYRIALALLQLSQGASGCERARMRARAHAPCTNGRCRAQRSCWARALRRPSSTLFVSRPRRRVPPCACRAGCCCLCRRMFARARTARASHHVRHPQYSVDTLLAAAFKFGLSRARIAAYERECAAAAAAAAAGAAAHR
jgi:hypothetical protein